MITRCVEKLSDHCPKEPLILTLILQDENTESSCRTLFPKHQKNTTNITVT